MSASREKKTRQDADESVLSQREEKRRQEERQARRSTVLYAVVGVICVVFAAALLIWNSGILQRNLTAVTVDGEKYTAADVQYYFNINRISTIELYYTYTYSYPFDISKSLKDQVYDEETGESWYDHLMEQTMDTIAATVALNARAESEGYTLSQEGQEALDQELESLETLWIKNGYSSRDAYLRAQYGSFLSYDRYKELLTQDLLAADYAQSVQDGYTYEDKDYQDYYEEHKDELDTLVLTYFTLRAHVETTDEDGNELDLTDEEKEAALEEAKTQVKAQAEELMDRLEAGEDPEALAEEYEDVLSSHAVDNETESAVVNSAYAEWALDDSRKAGDVTLAEYDTTGTSYYYYVVRFEDRYLDETPTADVRHILVAAEQDEGADEPTEEQYDAARAEAEDLLAQWEAGDATEDSFAALAGEHSADTSSAQNGGLITGINEDSGYVDTFTEWALDPARKPGDTGIVQNTGSSIKGWHIMYYVGENDPAWKLSVDRILRSEDYSQWEDEAVEGCETATGMGLRFVKG